MLEWTGGFVICLQIVLIQGSLAFNFILKSLFEGVEILFWVIDFGSLMFFPEQIQELVKGSIVLITVSKGIFLCNQNLKSSMSLSGLMSENFSIKDWFRFSELFSLRSIGLSFESDDGRLCFFFENNFIGLP